MVHSGGQAGALWGPSGALERMKVRPLRWGRFDRIVFMAIVTPMYLAFELGFNASLLNTTGTLVSFSQVQDIEQWGRIISGVALALFVWGVVLLPLAEALRVRLSIVFALLLATLALSIMFTFDVEKHIVDSRVDQQTAAQRRLAVQVQAAQSAIFTGKLTLAGMPSSIDLSSPAGKAFMSVFPFLVTSVPDLGARMKDVLPAAIEQTVRTRSPDPAKLYNTTILAADDQVEASYRQYVAGENQRIVALSNERADERLQWDSYVQNLQFRGLNYRNVPLRYWGQVRRDLSARGLDLPIGWDPADQVTFDRAVDRNVEETANLAYANATSFVTGRPLPLNMSFIEFARIPQVVSSWRSSLHLAAGHDPWLTPLTPYSEWEVRDYDSKINAKVQQELYNIFLPTEDFEPGGSMEQQGFQAAEAMYAPPVALSFSILGALIHLFKSAKYLLLVGLRRHARLIHWATLAVAIGLGMTPFFLPNAISESKVFSAMAGDMGQNLGMENGPVAADLTRWVVQAQPYFYPVSDVFTRAFAACGFQFDQNAPFGRSPAVQS